ncbi:MAG TPA: S8 family serine peptidase [Marinobacter sp.]|nr:S8 family serine peptidase [Marinobacter sp.]
MSALIALALAGCGGGGSDGFITPPPEDPLAGIIAIEANSRIDQDTMDELGLVGAQPASTVQSLPVNFVLAGYVSANSGSYTFLNGQAATFGYEMDEEDRFTVRLVPGDTIRLESFGSRAGDPTLELEISGSLGGFVSDSTSATTSAVVVAAPGSGDELQEYQLTVRATGGTGAARYVLTREVISSALVTSFHWPDYDFVPGEALVTLADEGARISALAAGTAEMKRHLGKSDWLVAMPAQVFTAVPDNANARKQATLEWVGELRRQPGIASAEPNYLFRSQSTPVEEPLYARNWHYDLINGPTAWQIGAQDGSDVRVAVLDSGILQVSDGGWHPDLDDKIGSVQLDLIDGGDAEDPGSSVGGDVFHGTHVAGTIGAAINGDGIGGVSFNSSIVPVRVLSEGGTGNSADLIEAIRWVTNEGALRADVVNMSLGGLPRIEALEDALADGVEAGVIYVAAAGNSATNVPSYPAASESVFAVSAVDAGGQPASYSNFGSWIDLAAPGGDASRDANLDGQADLVWSASGERSGGMSTPGYRGLQGTSMASPHVAGVIALMKAENPALNFGQIKARLETTDRLLTQGSGSSDERLGWGVIDAAKAVSSAATGADITVLSASPAFVRLSNEGANAATVSLRQYGDGEVDNVRVGPTPDWLRVIPDDVASPAQLTFELIPEALDQDEPARVNVIINYNVDNNAADPPLTIPVTGELISDQQARTAGRHFVLLINTEPNDNGVYPAESQVAVDVQNGQYEFRFEADDGEEPQRLAEVRPGTYFLVAGTDIDGDGLICQAGEACAEYPIAGLREPITIEEGRGLSGLRMTTSFSRPTSSATSADVLPRPGFQGYQLMGETPFDRTTENGAKAIQ